MWKRIWNAIVLATTALLCAACPFQGDVMEFSIDTALQNGLRKDARQQRNAQVLAWCQGLIPTEYGLKQIPTATYPITDVDGDIARSSWPFPQLKRAERTLLLLDGAAAYVVDESDWSTTAITAYNRDDLNAATIVAPGTWHVAGFQDSWIATAGGKPLFNLPVNPTAKDVIQGEGAFLVNTVANHDNRLVMGGISGSCLSANNWPTYFQLWQDISGRYGNAVTTEDQSFDDEWVIWSEKAGGSNDLPFATLLAAFELCAGSINDNLHEVVLGAIEDGGIGMMPLRGTGTVQIVKVLGNDLIAYGDRGVSRLVPTERGYVEDILLDVGVDGLRGVVDGDEHEHVMVDAHNEVWRLRAGDAPVREGYSEFIALMFGNQAARTSEDPIVTFDPSERNFFIAAKNIGFCLTRTGLGDTIGMRPTSLIRSADHTGLVGTFMTEEMLLHGDFADFTGTIEEWTLEAGWAHNAGDVDLDGTTASTNAAQIKITDEQARTFRVAFTISDYSVGSVTPTLDDNSTPSVGTARSADGTFTEDIVAGGDDENDFQLDGTGFTGTIDDVSVKDVAGIEALIITEAFDGGNRDVKQVSFVRLATTDTDATGWQVAIDWRMDKSTAWQRTSYVTCDARGVARVKSPGVEFRIVCKAADRTLVDLDRIDVEMVKGKMNLRAVVDGS